MKILYTCIFLLTTTLNWAQFDVNDFGIITIGAGYKKTTHQGFYAQSTITPFSNGSVFVNADNYSLPEETGKCLSPELKAYISNENTLASINFDFAYYFIGVIAGIGDDKFPDRFQPGKLDIILSTPSPNIQSVDAVSDLKREKRFWCYDIIDVNATFGSKSLTLGFDVGWKALGFSWPGTYFLDNSNTYAYHDTGSGKDKGFRFYIGPSIGFRKNLIEELGLVLFAGANYLPNIFGDPKFSRKLINPYIHASLFFGAEKGFGLHFNYQFLKGKNEFTGMRYTSLSSEAITLNSDLKVTQLELKLSYFFTRN